MSIALFRSVWKLTSELAGLIVDFGYDLYTCVRYSNFFFSRKEQETLFASITMQIHNIEKGLSLPQPRPGFGRNNLTGLFRNARVYIDRYGVDALIGRAQGALRAYVRFHNDCGCETYPFRADIGWILSLNAPQSDGGTLVVNRQELHRLTQSVPEAFFLSRHSVRCFTDERVDLEKVVRAVRIAQKSPSVCNRQSGYVYVLTEPVQIAEALALQGGADGFAQNVPLLLVVTSRTANFWVGERNERWVDGGLFAMSLIYGLHREGLGSCALNWCKSAFQDIRFKKRIDIPADRSILFLLAVGNVPETVRVACSQKRSLEDMYEIR